MPSGTDLMELPLILQSGDDLSVYRYASPDGFGLGSVWLSARVALLGQRESALFGGQSPIDLAFQLGSGLPFGVGRALAVESGFNLVPSVSAGRTLGQLRLGGELNAPLRFNPVALTAGTGALRDQVGSQLNARLMVGSVRTGLNWEVSGQTAFALGGEKTPPGLELLGAVRFPVGPTQMFLGAGPGFGSLPGTPTVRVFGGISFGPQASPIAHAPALAPAPAPVVETPAPAAAPADPEPVQPEVSPVSMVVSLVQEMDSDGDGVPDVSDQCPGDVEDKDGFKDEDGCRDTDNDQDGLLDADDACRDAPGFIEDKGCPRGPADKDQDGVIDDEDQCPAEAGPADRKGCPAADSDGDKVEDALDNCPKVKGSVENSGCPVSAKQLVSITRERLVIKDKVFFDSDKAVIQVRSFPLLNQVASVLAAHPEVELVQVEGHTDGKGKAAYNRKLSQSRAEAVRAYLVKKGLDPERLAARGFGPDRPVASNDNEAGREKNRRVEFTFATEEKVTTEPAQP